jgi:hypothetical protein
VPTRVNGLGRLARNAAALVVGRADDPLERAADEAARVVVETHHATSTGRVDGPRVALRALHRQSSTGAAGGAVDAGTAAELAHELGRGSPLPSRLRQWVEPSFRADLGDVRLHTGPTAKRLNDRVEATAFTVGSDVVFRDGMPDTASPAGQRLLAHELAHVVQQRGAGLAVPPHSDGGGPRTALVQRHASFEHRLLGDVPPGDLFELGTHQELAQSGGQAVVNIPLPGGANQAVPRANVEHLLEQELHRLRTWQQQDPQVQTATLDADLTAAKTGLEQNDATWNVRLVAIPSTPVAGQPAAPPLLVTYGELNTLADFYGSVDELKRADPSSAETSCRASASRATTSCSRSTSGSRRARPPRGTSRCSTSRRRSRGPSGSPQRGTRSPR